MRNGTSLRTGVFMPIALIGLAGWLLIGGAAAVQAAEVSLSPLKKIRIAKSSGTVEQVAILSGGAILVRDSNLAKPKEQALELYDSRGQLTRRIGKVGPEPGGYRYLKSVAATRDHAVWVADLIGRLSFFSLEGRLLGTKLIQKPGYQIDSIALDEPHGYFYVGGCLPIRYYLDDGCRLVHQYRTKDRAFVRSFLQTDKASIENRLFAFSNISVDVDAAGRLWTIDAPVFKLLLVDPGSGKELSFPVESRIARPMPKIEQGADTEGLYENSFHLDRVLASGPYEAVSLRRPQGGLFLAIFDAQGKQIAADLKPPGVLVGKTGEGRFLFASPVEGGFEIGEYQVKASKP